MSGLQAGYGSTGMFLSAKNCLTDNDLRDGNVRSHTQNRFLQTFKDLAIYYLILRNDFLVDNFTIIEKDDQHGLDSEFAHASALRPR